MNIGFHGSGVVALHQSVEGFVQVDRLPFLEAVRKVLARQEPAAVAVQETVLHGGVGVFLAVRVRVVGVDLDDKAVAGPDEVGLGAVDRDVGLREGEAGLGEEGGEVGPLEDLDERTRERELRERFVAVLECIGLLTIAVASLELGQTIFEEEIQRSLDRKVSLKSGGYLIIDQTEALTTIDVNTGGYVGARNFDDTIFKTNLEAAQAIARQLRLRNLGGIIIVDFIDMESQEHRDAVLAEAGVSLVHVSIYSVRPTPQATVSMPVTWEEVEEGVDIGDFTVANARDRLLDRGDLHGAGCRCGRAGQR